MLAAQLGLLRVKFVQNYITRGRNIIFGNWKIERMRILQKYKRFNTMHIIFCEK